MKNETKHIVIAADQGSSYSQIDISVRIDQTLVKITHPTLGELSGELNCIYAMPAHYAAARPDLKNRIGEFIALVFAKTADHPKITVLLPEISKKQYDEFFDIRKQFKQDRHDQELQRREQSCPGWIRLLELDRAYEDAKIHNNSVARREVEHQIYDRARIPSETIEKLRDEYESWKKTHPRAAKLSSYVFGNCTTEQDEAAIECLLSGGTIEEAESAFQKSIKDNLKWE